MADAPFVGFYSLRLRDYLRCLTGQELMVFVALASYVNEAGTCYPGVRELSAVTTYPPQIVSDLLKSLQDKHLVVFLRQAARDPLTGRMVPDVYAVNPEIVLVSKPEIWHENRLRHVSIPESTFPVKSAQPDRITEPESVEPKAVNQNYSPEGAATLKNAKANPHTHASRENAGTTSAAGSAHAPNSHAQRHTPSPGSGAPPSRELTFSESVIANAIRREIPDMSAETVRLLIARHGVDQVNAAVMSYKKRSERQVIKRPTGWIIQNLKSGAKMS